MTLGLAEVSALVSAGALLVGVGIAWGRHAHHGTRLDDLDAKMDGVVDALARVETRLDAVAPSRYRRPITER